MSAVPVIPRRNHTNSGEYTAKISVIKTRETLDHTSPDAEYEAPNGEWAVAQGLILDYCDALADIDRLDESVFLVGLCKNLVASGVPIIEIAHTAYEYLKLVPEALDRFESHYYKPSPQVRRLGAPAVKWHAQMISA